MVTTTDPLDTVTAAERRLRDPRLGLLTAVTRHPPGPGVPAAWVGYGAHVAATEVYAPWTVDRYGFGASLGDPDQARRAAIGEAVERYCGNIVPEGLIVASYEQLRRAGQRAVDPMDLALYSPQQYATAGFPFVAFTRDLPVAWVSGTCLHTGEPTLVPAALAYLNYYTGSRRGEPPVTALSYAGIATGVDRSHAERFALEELFERDATTLWWLSGARSALVTDAHRLVDQLDDEWTAITGDTDLTATGEGSVAVRLRHVPSSFAVPVLAAFVTDHARGVVAFGSAARADPQTAATKALVEAIGMYTLTIKLTDPDSDLWEAVEQGIVPRHVFRPYRADRSYRDAFRADLRDLVDLPAVAQLYLDPRMQGQPLERLRAPEPTTVLDQIPAVPAERARQEYLTRLEQAGLRAVSVDLTTTDVAAAGLRVVRVLVAGLYGNCPPAFPLHGGRRLHTEPLARGWTAGPLTAADLARPPIPLA